MTVAMEDKRIVGNAHVRKSLERVAGSPHLGHAYLFFGPDGIGKRLAATSFARAINCTCGAGTPTAKGSGRGSGSGSGADLCESCRLMDAMNHPEFMVLQDLNKPRWIPRSRIREILNVGDGNGGGSAGGEWLDTYTGLLAGLLEKGYLEEPLPDTGTPLTVDGINLVTDKLFGRGSVPSKECYTPQPVSDEIRKSFDRGDLSEGEFNFLKMLFEFPLSVVPYRGAIPIAYVTTRKTWKFTRPIQPFLSVRTMLGGKKIVVIDDAHKMSAEAQNCILKTLEEPPPDSVLILVTSDKRALFETIVSRCQVVSFGRLTREETEEAVKGLLGEKWEGTGLISALSENCPGRLLELALENIDERLENVKEFFSGVADGRLAGSFRLSGAVMESAGRHRRNEVFECPTVTEALELVGFWIAQVLRVGAGLPDTTGVPAYAEALKHHSQSFERDALLRASEHLERSFDLVRWNVDMRLLLDTTLLRIARTLG
ncbi:hypothetical protein ACFL2Z_04985 [Candidatus Eisenbacteria bacterium]|uniref:DNA polymerase III subunit delta n=1 Tax=Eiseniibacteriota bacterium TaxID=2212470 RepID=A0ABV6YQ90_UNCEI